MPRGVALDHTRPEGKPDPILLPNLSWVRLQARLESGLPEYIDSLHGAGISVALVFDSDSFPSGLYGRDIDQHIQQLGGTHPDLAVIGNEMDAWALPEPSPSSWSMQPFEYAGLFSSCYYPVKVAWPQTPIIMGGLVSGQPGILPDYLRELKHTPPAGVDIHPYGRTAPQAKALFTAYRAYHSALYCLEWNRPAAEITQFQLMLDGQTRASCWFCWSDAMVEGMGVVDTAGKLTEAGCAVMAHPILGQLWAEDWPPYLEGYSDGRRKVEIGYEDGFTRTTPGGTWSVKHAG